jgi:hypothetical protein
LRKVLWLFAAAALVHAADEWVDKHRSATDQLIRSATTSTDGYARLTYLCDRIGNRISSSPAMAKAVTWAAAEMKAAGFENVVTSPVKVPNWIRGDASLRVVKPYTRDLALLALGGSVGTPTEGITAPVVVVSSFTELDALGTEKVKGRIVLFNPNWEGYGRTVQYRSAGAIRAAKLGAVAVLVRSVTGNSLYTPHTGAMNYAADTPQIPAAAITVEDAGWMARLQAAGEPLTVTLKLGCQRLADATSANVIGEIRGRELPDEIVVIGGHLDSWDVGQGAQDDGSGAMAALEAVRLISKLPQKPRRTIRVVLFTDEEFGGSGGRAYEQWAGNTVEKHFAAIEMDGGAEAFAGFGVSPEPAWQRFRAIGRLLEPLGSTSVTVGGGGADIAPLMRRGVPGVGHRASGGHYFDWHHTNADTIDKVDPKEFQKNVAALAVMAYVLAEME